MSDGSRGSLFDDDFKNFLDETYEHDNLAGSVSPATTSTGNPWLEDPEKGLDLPSSLPSDTVAGAIPVPKNSPPRSAAGAPFAIQPNQQEIVFSPPLQPASSAITVTPVTAECTTLSVPLQEKPTTTLAARPSKNEAGQKHSIDDDNSKNEHGPSPDQKRMKLSTIPVTKRDALLGHKWPSKGKKDWRRRCKPYQRNDAIISDKELMSLVEEFEQEKIEEQGRTRKVLEEVAIESLQLPQEAQLYRHGKRFYKRASVKAIRCDISKNYTKNMGAAVKSLVEVIRDYREYLRNIRRERRISDESQTFEEEARVFEETLKELENGSFSKPGGKLKVQLVREKHSIAMIKSMWKALTAKTPSDSNTPGKKRHQGFGPSKDQEREGDEDDEDKKHDEDHEADREEPGVNGKSSKPIDGPTGTSLQYDADNESILSVDSEEYYESSDDEESHDNDSDDDDGGAGPDDGGSPIYSNPSPSDKGCFISTESTLATTTKTSYSSQDAPLQLSCKNRAGAGTVASDTLKQSENIASRKDPSPCTFSIMSSLNETNTPDEAVTRKLDTHVSMQFSLSEATSGCKEDSKNNSAGSCAHPVQLKPRETESNARPQEVELLKEQIKIMLKREAGAYKTQDYLSPKTLASVGGAAAGLPAHTVASTSFKSLLSPSEEEQWRWKICKWLYKVAKHFNLSSEVVSVSINYLDRFLATQLVHEKEFQLASMTVLLIAIKLCAPGGRVDVPAIRQLCTFKYHQFDSMEMRIFRTLSWHMCPPTANCFAEHIISLLPDACMPRHVKHMVCDLARFLVELSVKDYGFIVHRQSELAMAALLVAMEDLSFSADTVAEFTNRITKQGFPDATSDGVEKCRWRLRRLYKSYKAKTGSMSGHQISEQALGSPHRVGASMKENVGEKTTGADSNGNTAVPLSEQCLLDAKEMRTLSKYLRTRPGVYNKVLAFACQQESSGRASKVAEDRVGTGFALEFVVDPYICPEYLLHSQVAKTAREIHLDIDKLESVIPIAKRRHVKLLLLALKFELKAEESFYGGPHLRCRLGDRVHEPH